MTDQLDLRKTYGAILNAAREKRFISYGDLAKANNAEWSKVYRKMGHHLGQLIQATTVPHDWPMLTAIVVNKADITTGRLVGTAYIGFLKIAEAFGFDTTPRSFIEDQQRAMFAWAETAPPLMS